MTLSPAEPRFARTRAFLHRRVLPYLPYPHLMALAPLDVVLRLLWRPEARIPWPYWPRLIFLLIPSALQMIVSLPERLIMAAWLRWRPPPIPRHRAPIFVLGYFRSGTTFLQSLLASDPMLRTPRWVEVLAPQAFVPGWLVLRYLLIPFLPVARGLAPGEPLAPALPAEDEFAMNNWGLVSLEAGRIVLLQARPFYDRFNDLDDLTPAEFSRWKRYQRAFVQKLMLASGGRRLVLKSPAHTARVRHLLKLFPGAKFVHISRPPLKVFQSNLHLLDALHTAFALQYPSAEENQEEMLVDEYLASERHYLADKALIPPGDVAEVRLQDLAADPTGELKRIYRELDLPFSRAYEQLLVESLTAPRQRTPFRHSDLTEAQTRRAARLEPLRAIFGHDRPTIPKVRPPIPPQARPMRAAAISLAVAAACLAVWYPIARWTAHEQSWLVWPMGIAIGHAASAGARGSEASGAWAAVLTLLVLVAETVLYASAAHGTSDPALIAAVVEHLFSPLRIFFAAFGGVTAYWIGSGRPA